MNPLDQILDADLLPERVESFLKVRGWTLFERRKTGTVWASPHLASQHGRPVVFVPRTGTERFRRRMREALWEIAEISAVSAETLVSDYKASGEDRVQVRLVADETAAGSIPFLYARQLLESTRELLAAGARSAHAAVANFPQHQPRIVDRYLEGLILDQTQVGSFVLQITSPLGAGAAQLALESDRELDEGLVPFERLAMLRLADGVRAARNILELPVDQIDGPALNEAVAVGMSSNLCSALTRLRTEEIVPSVEVRVAWARSRPVGEPVSSIVFAPDDLRRLESVDEVLRARHPQPNYEVHGIVTEMKRVRNLVGGGRVVLQSEESLPGPGRLVYVDLEDEAGHQRAIQAYASGERLTARGTLHHGGTRWLLLDAELR